MRIFDRNLAVFSLDEIFCHAASKRPRTVKCNHRDQVFETLRMKLHEKACKAGGF